MSLGNVQDGYLSSPFPWVSSSIYTTSPSRHDFDTVTRFLVVRNFGPGDLAIGFTRNGVLGQNRFVIASGQAFEAAVSCKELHVVAITAATGSVFAGLSGTPAKFMPLLTGTLPNTTGSTGWAGVG